MADGGPLQAGRPAEQATAEKLNERPMHLICAHKI